MKSTELQITIPKPCSQAWDSLVPAADGRHCNVCNKTVIDFTNKTDQEIKTYFSNHTGKVCGNFKVEQLDVFSKPSVSKGLSVFSVLILFLMCFTVHTQAMPISSGISRNTASYVLIEEDIDEDELVITNNDIVGDSIMLKGRVRGGNAREFVPNAKVTVDGTNIVATSDSLGRFVLKIPKTNRTYIPITLEAHGFEKQNSRLNVLARNEQSFYLPNAEDSLIRGEVIYNPSKK